MTRTTDREVHRPEGRAFDRRLLARLWPFAKPERGLFAAGFLLLFLVTGIELLGPYVLRRALSGPVAATVAAGGGVLDALSALRLHAAAFAALVVVGAGVRLAQFLSLHVAGQRVLHRVRCAVFDHLQSLPIAYFDRQPAGRLVSRVTSDVETLNELFTTGAVTLLADLVKVTALLGALFWIDVRLAWVAALGVPVLAFAAGYFRVRARRSYRLTRRAIAEVTTFLGETVAGIDVLQGFGREDKALSEFARRNEYYLAANLKTILYFALFFPVVDWVAVAVQGASLWQGGLGILGGTLSVPEFLQFWLYLSFVFEPLRELAEKYNVFQSAMASAERVFGVMDEDPEPPDPPGALAGDDIRGEVRFENVWFAYRDREWVLEGVDLLARPGETVALVGATGSGKTTITALLQRFYTPARGVVSIDGVPIERYARRDLRRRIAYVPQDVFLFAGTVMENLCSGSSEVTRQRARAAVDALGARPFFLRLEGGFEHRLRERGSDLSAGERQLVALVRALAVDPAVLVLDEATANVDPETEALLQRAVARLLAGRTALVVAHRLSTVRHADRIVVLHKGKVREVGRHDELVRRGGLYARLHRLQFGGGDPPQRLRRPR